MEIKRSDRYAYIAIFVLVVLLIVFGILLFKQYQRTAHFQTMWAQRNAFENVFRHKILTINDVGYIQPWMTFDYVNTAFKIPANYLKTTLDVNSPQYPRITIGRYAKDIATSSQEFIILVQNDVRSYLSATTSATTTLSK